MAGLRRRPRSAALLRLGYRVAYRGLCVWSVLARPRTRGVKCVLLDDDGRALFVRHAYGTRANWELPGGGARRTEPAADAVRREAREELGIDDDRWRPLAVAEGIWHGKHERLDIFVTERAARPVRFDPVEIADAGWFALDAPPQPLGPSTRMALRAMPGV